MLPAIRRDPGYLAREHLDLVGGPGDAAPVVPPTPENIERLLTGAVRLRQRQGPTNSLGLVKFVFPNDDDVYMHGTPATALFRRARRDFSHGCVRVEDPVALATWVLGGDNPDWTRERVVEAMHAQESHTVELSQPVQVILFYMTAVVSPDDSSMRFSADIYRQDAMLARALQAARPALPVPDPSGVDVNEIGGGVVADAAATRVERRGAQLPERHVGQADVDRLSFHVQAARRHAFAVAAEHGVGRRRPISGNHLIRP
jgi:hypothetical protein